MSKWQELCVGDEDNVDILENAGFNPIIAKLLVHRGIDTLEKTENFFDLSLKKGQGYSSSTRTADTTIDRDWYVSFQWGTNSASNEIIQSILTIQQI